MDSGQTDKDFRGAAATAASKGQANFPKYENDQNDVDRPLADRPAGGQYMGSIINERFGRRAFVQGAVMAAPILAAPNMLIADRAEAQNVPASLFQETLGFQPIQPTDTDTVVVPEGYTTDVVIRWGDSINPDVADLDTTIIAEGGLADPAEASAQANRFGVACDAAHFFPIDGSSDDGVICVNHEFTNDQMLFPLGTGAPTFLPEGAQALEDFYNGLTQAQQQAAVELGINAHGVTIAQIRRGQDGAWALVRDSTFNRRLTGQTPMNIGGPAAGDQLLQASMSAETGQIGQDGTQALGTLNNCAGGQTPYRTYVSCEENFDQYFGRLDVAVSNAEEAGNTKLARAIRSVSAFAGGDGPSQRRWESFGRPVDQRFDLVTEPTEIVRFGWLVEVDPFDPNDVPTKRTALGRFKHESATNALTTDSRLAIYSGDDARLEFVYKFVTEGQVTENTTKADNLLDSGTLYVARFDANGRGEWLALVQGQNGLTPENGFDTQADVLINTREAATIAGATAMDRPEDIEAFGGRVYVALTENGEDFDDEDARDPENVDGPNPRLRNSTGHVVEITEDGLDHGSTTFRWEIFILCGDPLNTRFISNRGIMRRDATLVGRGIVGGLADETTYYGGFGDPTAITPVNAPDNLTSDNNENLWIVTDGNSFGNDGCFAAPTVGVNRGRIQQFMSGPVDCEVCGAEFTPDNRTFFLNIQHPGDGGGAGSPTSNWPDAELPADQQPVDANGNVQPRGSLIAVRRIDGGVVGS